MKDVVDAKAKLGALDALRLARAVSKVIVAKARRLTRFDLKKDAPDDDTLVSHMLGPTGHLRAPTLRKGKTLLVGFHEDTYAEVFATGGRRAC